MADDRRRLNPHLQQVIDYDVQERSRAVDLEPADLARLADLRADLLANIDEDAATFFAYLERQPDASGLFARRELLDEARRLKREHLIQMAAGVYDRNYVTQRAELGLIYSRAKLEPRVFLGAFNALVRSIAKRIAVRFGKDSVAAQEHIASLDKIAFFDLGIIVDVLIADREHTITLQQEAIRELSTPTLQLRDRLLILPIIGVLDTFRARQLTEGLLQAIRSNRAKVVVMDVTGVPTVDSKVANHLLQTVAASRLMGAQVIVTGLSADVAQSLVTLGVDLTSLNAVGDLQGGLEEAERLLGYEVLRQRSPTRQFSAG